MAAAPPAGYTQANWAQQVLSDAGLPQTQNNIDNIVRWMAAEEPPSDWWDRNNPLNSSLNTTSTSGLGTYSSLTVAAWNVAEMLKQTNMAGIYNALKANADPCTFSAAVVASPWASSHYGGNPNHICDIAVPTLKIAAVGPGTSEPGTGAGTTGTTGSPLSSCAVPFPISISGVAGSSLGVLGSLLGIGSGSPSIELCILTKGQVKALTGALAVAAGAGMFAFGVVLVAAYGFDHSGAKQAVSKATRTVGIPASLLAGQPEVAAGIAAGTRGSSRRSSTPPARREQPRTAGRRESREIERQYAETERQQGPIGPRGGSATSRRVAFEQRRGTSVPAAGRPRTPEQRQRARERARQPF